MALHIQFKARTNFNVQVYAGHAQRTYKSVLKNRPKFKRSSASTIQGTSKIRQTNFHRRSQSKIPHKVPNSILARNQQLVSSNKTVGRHQKNLKKYSCYRNSMATRCLKFRIQLPGAIDPNNLFQFVQYRTKVTGSKWSENTSLYSLKPNNISFMKDDDVKLPWNDNSIQCEGDYFDQFSPKEYIQPSRNDGEYSMNEEGDLELLDNDNSHCEGDYFHPRCDEFSPDEYTQQSRSVYIYDEEKDDSSHSENIVNSMTRRTGYHEFMNGEYIDSRYKTPVFQGVHLVGDGHMLQLAIEVADNIYEIADNIRTVSVAEWGLCSSGQTIMGLSNKLQYTSCIGKVCCVMVGSMDIIRLAGASDSLEESMTELIRSYQKLKFNLKKNFEHIIWLNLLPIPRMENYIKGRVRFRYREAIEELNKFLYYDDDGERIFVLDVNRFFTDERGNANIHYFNRPLGERVRKIYDGIHLNQEGMYRLINTVETNAFRRQCRHHQ